MSDDVCKRLQNLEQHQVETLLYRKMREELELKHERIRQSVIHDVKKDLSEIKQFMIQQKSFVGAVFFIISGMYAIITLFADKIFK